MRIDDLSGAPLTPETGKSQAPSGKIAPQNDQQTAASGTDRADLSQLARALANDRPSRIEQLRLEVESGKYEVPADEVAQAIINHHTRK